MVHFPQCRDGTVRMGVGHGALCASGHRDLVGHIRAGRVVALARLVLVWSALGFYADDQPRPWIAAPVPAGLGGVSNLSEESRPGRNKIARNESDAGFCRHCRFVLRPMDRAELHGVSPLDPAALQPPARTLHWQQRKLRAKGALARENHQRERTTALLP